MKNSDIKNIKGFLESINVCQRCQLRFLGIKEYTSYISKTSISDVIIDIRKLY